MQEFSYAFSNTSIDPASLSAGDNRRWTEGSPIDGHGQFSEIKARPYGDEPQLAAPMPIGHAQTEQVENAAEKR